MLVFFRMLFEVFDRLRFSWVKNQPDTYHQKRESACHEKNKLHILSFLNIEFDDEVSPLFPPTDS